jgi:hypothetical protein
MGYSEARGTLIYEKSLKSKISCQTPFKQKYSRLSEVSQLGTGLPDYIGHM